MSSKSKARLPAEPLISMRIAFLRPVANRVASKTPSAATREPRDEDRRVIDGDRSALGAGRAGQPSVVGRDRPLLHERLELPGHLGHLLAGDVLGEVDDVRADVTERTRARLGLVQPPRQWSLRIGDPVLEVLRAHVPHLADPALGDEPAGQRDRGHAAVGEADHRAYAVLRPPAPRRRSSPPPRRPCWPAASRTARACPPPERRSRSRRACPPGVQMSTRSTSGALDEAAPVGLGLGPAEPCGRLGGPLGVAAADDPHGRGQREVEEARRGPPGLGVGGAHEGVAHHAHREGGAGAGHRHVPFRDGGEVWIGLGGAGGPGWVARPTGAQSDSIRTRTRCRGTRRRCPRSRPARRAGSSAAPRPRPGRPAPSAGPAGGPA